MAKQIRVEHVFKVFGNHPKQALALAREGQSKQQILEKTGQSIGVFDADFTIEAGEIFVIMVLSGSGKSTLLRMLNGLVKPTAGRIVVEGQDINALPAHELRALRRKDISMVFQSFALMPHMTVLENTAFGLELAGVPLAERQKQAAQALEQVGLGGWGGKYPDELSGGMQQRVGLARALAADPAILLMDEAFSALDPIIRTEMQSELLRLQQARQRTIVFISHDLQEAMRIGDRIAIMRDAQVVQIGTPDEILRAPANDYVRSFVRGVDASAVFKAADIARKPSVVYVSHHADRGCRPVLALLQESDRSHAYIVNSRQQFEGVVSEDALRDALHDHTGPLGLRHAMLANVPQIDASAPVADLVGLVAHTPYAVPVVGEGGRFLGAISKNTLLKFLDPGTPPLPEASGPSANPATHDAQRSAA